MGAQVHLQLHTGRILAEHFFFIGNFFFYEEKTLRKYFLRVRGDCRI